MKPITYQTGNDHRVYIDVWSVLIKNINCILYKLYAGAADRYEGLIRLIYPIPILLIIRKTSNGFSSCVSYSSGSLFLSHSSLLSSS